MASHPSRLEAASVPRLCFLPTVCQFCNCLSVFESSAGHQSSLPQPSQQTLPLRNAGSSERAPNAYILMGIFRAPSTLHSVSPPLYLLWSPLRLCHRHVLCALFHSPFICDHVHRDCGRPSSFARRCSRLPHGEPGPQAYYRIRILEQRSGSSRPVV
jgi:hypothetical protein